MEFPDSFIVLKLSLECYLIFYPLLSPILSNFNKYQYRLTQPFRLELDRSKHTV